ncbi:MAG: hypothetical protein COS94_03480 [Candidatus Hydrogenedentes bacterium CG07_land_8_20_14_0_80_42_17]|nr:MAG: hypothetical protein COS94_03480 [Candidatus Hydrogenedentes bacterium CG07_land_8_20_14_0_80_42_17]
MIRSISFAGRILILSIGILFLISSSVSDKKIFSNTPLYAATINRSEILNLKLSELISKCPGTPSIKILFLNSGYEMEFRSGKVVRAASVIKLPICVAVMSLCRKGKGSLPEPISLVEEDRTSGSGILRHRRFNRDYTVEELIKLMILESDNTATNALIRRFGLEEIQNEFEKAGLIKTKLKHRILEASEDNPISSSEIVDLLSAIADTSQESSIHPDDRRWIFDLLKQTSPGARLGRYLPDEAKIAHKTGTLRREVHDAGIIETDSNKIIVSALIEKAKSRKEAERWLGRLGRLICETKNDLTY